MASNLSIARIFALGREGDPEFVFGSGAFPRNLQTELVLFFENRHEDFFGGAGIGGALQNNDLAGAQMGRDGMSRVGDVAQVGLVVFVERSGDADDDGVHVGRSANSWR